MNAVNLILILKYKNMSNESALAQFEIDRENNQTEEVPCDDCGNIECNCDEEEDMEMTIGTMDRF